MSDMPNWLYPRGRASVDTWNVRLGRVFHWIGIGLAIVAFSIAALGAVSRWSQVKESDRALAAWNARHGQPVIKPPASEWDQFKEWDDPNDPRPFKSEMEWGFFGVIVAIGGLLYITGRTLRYLVGGE